MHTEQNTGRKGRPPGWTKADAKPETVKYREYHKNHYEERKRLEGVETQRARAEKMQEAYIRNVQADYLYYCDYVHNHNRAADDLRWYPSKFHKYICRKAQEFVDKETEKAFEILIISCPPQHGKLLADSSPVITRSKGWITHGELEVGDEVLNHRGEFVKVTNVYPKGEANCKVTFTNGEEVYCHENHEWLVYDRSAHKERIVETKYMEPRVSYGTKEKKRGHRYNFMLPLREYVKGEEKELAVAPYVLGAWLGDGTNIEPKICAHPKDRIVLDEVRKIYPEGQEYAHKTTGVKYATYKGLRKDLQTYDMCYSARRTPKRIPEEYLTASIEQRLELLAGLIDTDGYLNKRTNRVTFSTAEESLRDSFCELIATFGWRTSVYECKPTRSTSGVEGRRPCWQVCFNPDCEIPCRLERKRPSSFSKQRRVAICSIERCAPRQGNCITVEGGIYLVGRSMIPTHNSESVTATLPSWYVMRNPDKHVIQVSYGDDLSRKFGLANLNKVKEFGEIFGVEVDPNRKAAVNFGLKGHQGGVKSAGYGAGITGNPADLIIIDDPVKNMAEADSARDREKKWDDFEASIKSRLSAHGKIILIMTRWHEDDLAGRLIEHYKDFVEVINLPCEAEEHDVLGRSPGDALCPEIGKDNAWLDSFKKTHMSESGLRSWNALYQGRPTAMEGNLLKREWWQYYERKDYLEGRLRFDTMMMSVDCAFKDATTSDYTAIEVWGKLDNRMYLVDLVNDHLDAMATVNTILLLSARYAEIRLILVEDKANGPAVMQLLRDKIMGVVGVTPDGSKEQRVNAVSYYVEAGNVFLPNDCGFTFEFVDQCAAFPNGKHDDMVDACFGAGTKVATLFGDKNIEDIQVGDRVITPFGVRRVTQAKCTGEKEVIHKFGLTVTPEHKFATKDGFKKIDSLTKVVDCSILSVKEAILWNHKKVLCSMASNINLWGEAVITSHIHAQTKDADTLKACMSLSGKNRMGRCLLVAKYTTKMAIALIMTLAILSVYRSANIAKFILGVISNLSTSKRSGRSQKNGTQARKGLSGIENTPKEAYAESTPLPASGAEKNSPQEANGQSIVAEPVNGKPDTNAANASKNESARCAGKNSKPLSATTQTEPCAAASHAETGTSTEKVYNITVEKDHLYYAGGFLVKNCSMALNRLAYNRMLKREIRRANNPFKIMPGRSNGKKFGRGERINVI